MTLVVRVLEPVGVEAVRGKLRPGVDALREDVVPEVGLRGRLAREAAREADDGDVVHRYRGCCGAKVFAVCGIQ